jgi:hypothetical protein
MMRELDRNAPRQARQQKEGKTTTSFRGTRQKLIELQPNH